jgi:hypothetical protein
LISPSKTNKNKACIRAYDTTDLRAELKCWENLRRCKGCEERLPRRKIWMIKGRDLKEVEIRGLKRVDWTWAVKDWMDGGRLCPRCRIGEYWPGEKDGEREGWLQCRSEGWARFTMFWNEERRRR